jgi:3',5'-cyclic AMP phosphodiesterase CpdA
MPDIIVQLSDSHIDAGAGDTGPVRALEATVEGVRKIHPLPVALLITGDLTEHGRGGEYARVREIVERLGIPVHPIPGNHDDRDALREAFSDHREIADTGAHINYSILVGGTRVLMCDTVIPGSDAGALHHETAEWLEAELAGDPQRPTLIAMHHPPIRTGIAAMDAIGMRHDDVVVLGELLRRAPNIGALLAGHVHRPIAGELGGCSVTTCPSTFFQLELDLGAEAPLRRTEEPPGFAVHVSDDRSLVSHIKFLSAHEPLA